MKNSKTLTLKIAISILTVVFFAVCIASGIVFASITSKISTNVPGVPTARLFSELWTTADTGGQITSGSIPKSSPLYVSATQSNGKEAVEPYCVMRAVATDNVTFDTSNWILQDNGWYYCTQVVGGGSKTRVALGQTTAEFKNANDKIVVELMQFSSNPNGFAKFWSPLAGRDTNSKISDSKTIDNVDISNPVGSVSWIANGDIVPYNTPASSTITPTQYLSQPDNYKTEANTLTAPIISAITANTQTSLTITSLNTTDNVDYLRVYNNKVLPIVLMMTITPYIVTNDVYNSSSTNMLGGLSFVNDQLKMVTSESGSIYAIYSEIIMPGEYVNTIPDTITITHSSDLNTISSIYLRVTFDYAEVDVFEQAMTTIQGGGDLGESFDNYYTVWTANTSLVTSLNSKYMDWYTALESNLPNGLTMPVYEKVGSGSGGTGAN